MTFEQYLQSLGWVSRDLGDGAVSWYNPDKETSMLVGSEQYTGLQDQFNAVATTEGTAATAGLPAAQTEPSTIKSPYGTAGLQGQDPFDQGPGTQPVTINGQQYVQFGTKGADADQWSSFGGGVIYDPNYGYVAPLSTFKSFEDATTAYKQSQGGFWAGLNNFFDAGGAVIGLASLVPFIGAAATGAPSLLSSLSSLLEPAAATATTEATATISEAAATQAVELATTGLPEAQISEALQVSGVEATVADTAATEAATGATATEVQTAIEAAYPNTATEIAGAGATETATTAAATEPTLSSLLQPTITPEGMAAEMGFTTEAGGPGFLEMAAPVLTSPSIAPPPPTGTTQTTPTSSTPTLSQLAAGASVASAVAGVVNNPDGGTTLTFDDGSTITTDAQGNPTGSTVATDTGEQVNTSGVPDTASATSAVSWLAKTLGISEGALRALGITGATALGLMGASSQTNTLKDIYNQFNAQGAPSRARFEGSFAPGFNLLNQPGYGDAFGRIADISARGYSSKFGNPAESNTAQAGILSDVWNQGYLPALNTYRSQNLTGGGQGTNVAGTAAIGGVQAGGGAYDALGYGLSSLLNPQQNYMNDYLKSITDYYKNRIPV